MKNASVSDSKKVNRSPVARIVHNYRKFRIKLSPQQNLLFGFTFYTVLGCVLLCLPFFQKIPVEIVDNLFIAASAISTTGLVTVSITDSYNFGGQIIILLLIQFGGIGYMTFSSFLLQMGKSKLTHWHQRILHSEFTLPKGFVITEFIKSVILYTIVIEVIGAILLYIAFTRNGMDQNEAIWSGIFHSISSFCTAGFGLYNDSFEQFKSHTSVQIIISVLSIAGALGFIVVADFWGRFSGKHKSISYTTKSIFLVTAILLLIGTVVIYNFEPTIIALNDHRLLNSFFQAMTALTTVGFNTVPIGVFTLGPLLIVIFLMYIGASPSGTGGGMKTTTFLALLAIMWSRIRSRSNVGLFGKSIPVERLYVAISIFMLYAGVVFFSTFVLALTESFELEKILFETTSAIGTVGLSTGITSGLSPVGKIIIIFVMFIGRLGLLTFGLAFFARRKFIKTYSDETDLAV